MLVVVDIPELPFVAVAVAADAPNEPDVAGTPSGRIPVAVPPAMSSLLAVCVAASNAPAAVARPPNPEYVCR